MFQQNQRTEDIDKDNKILRKFNVIFDMYKTKTNVNNTFDFYFYVDFPDLKIPIYHNLSVMQIKLDFVCILI